MERAFLTAKIHGHVFRFVRVKKVDKENSCGECDFEKKTIKIKKDMAKKTEAETLLHEILHSIDYSLAEPRIHTFSSNLYQIFKDNPKLLELIFPRPRK